MIIQSNITSSIALIEQSDTENSTYNSNKNTEGVIHCIEENKYISWIYSNHHLRIIILIDPPIVTQEIINIIEKTEALHFFIVLTGCHRRKKEYLSIWTSIYPFTIITPQTTLHNNLISKEYILDDNKVYILSFNTKTNQPICIAQIIGALLGKYRALLIYISPYIFSGFIIQRNNPHHYLISSSMNRFIENLPTHTIVLPELGGIHMLDDDIDL